MFAVKNASTQTLRGNLISNIIERPDSVMCYMRKIYMLLNVIFLQMRKNTDLVNHKQMYFLQPILFILSLKFAKRRVEIRLVFECIKL